MSRRWATPPPRLVAITDSSLVAPDELVARLQRLAQAAAPGSVALLLRDHAVGAKQRLALGQALRDVASRTEQQLWVADRLDLALLLEADAVHLGEASVSAVAARRLVGQDVGISLAWHPGALDVDRELDRLEQVDVLLVSPIFSPRKGRLALGLGGLVALGEQLRARNRACPLYALGGVTSANAAACLQASAAGVAAIGAASVVDARALLTALEILR